MTDPRVASIISVIFAAMGVISLYIGVKRIRSARQAGQRLRWYKQINFLAGLEYILLAVVFVLGPLNRAGILAPSVTNVTVPLYVVLLFAAAIFAGLVIHRVLVDIRTSRLRRQQAVGVLQTPTQPVVKVLPKDDTETQAQRQRERRKNAAAARRRRAGKA
jgi:hypothetical protein